MNGKYLESRASMRDQNITWTSVDLHPHRYMIEPSSRTKPDVQCLDGREQFMGHNSVTIRVSMKDL